VLVIYYNVADLECSKWPSWTQANECDPASAFYFFSESALVRLASYLPVFSINALMAKLAYDARGW